MSVLIRAVLLALACMLALTAVAGEPRKLNFNGDDRTYLVYRPAGLDRQHAAPLVIVLHGVFGNASQAEKAYHWDAEADEKGFVVVYPNGMHHSWNAGGICCGLALRDHVDDSGFLTALIQTLLATEHIDPTRVYVTGMSNGAAMAYRYACDHEFPIAAMGAVSGDLTGSCVDPGSVSVMEIHGLADHNIPLGGGRGSKGVVHVPWPPVRQGLDLFSRLDQCEAPDTRREGGVTTETADCKEGRQVVLITVADAGHQWPGAQADNGFGHAMPQLDPPSTALDATRVLWDFFSDKRGR